MIINFTLKPCFQWFYKSVTVGRKNGAVGREGEERKEEVRGHRGGRR